MAIVAICAGILLVTAAHGVTDDEIRHKLRKLWTESVCGQGPKLSLPGTDWFDADTNRLVRIMCELAQTNDVWNASIIMFELRNYATTNELPILYSCVTNRMCGYGATEAILRIEGITSNSVAAVDRYFAEVSGEIDDGWNHLSILSLMKRILSEHESSVVATNLVRSCMTRESLVNNICPRQIDESICRFDTGYVTSRRRLSALRAVYALGLNEYQIGYVTNAINELVAYPESALPD